MKIGIDCLDIKPNYSGGINTYLFGLLDGFKNKKVKNIEFIIFCTKNNKHIFESYKDFKIIEISSFNIVFRYCLLIPALILNSIFLWKFTNDIYFKYFNINSVFEKNCNLLYVPSTVLNSYNLNIPTILSMHDIQHVHYPEFFSKLRLRIRNLNFVNSAKKATLIQASSLFIKQDLLNNFKFLKPESVKVISEGVDINLFKKSLLNNIFKKYNIPKKFIFFPAQLWYHKNHLFVLESLKRIEKNKKIKISLVLTGAKFVAYNEIKIFLDNNKMSNVYYLGKIPWLDIVALYRNSKAMITATLYESSSLPILEAAASGIPVIAGNNAPNLELSQNLNLNLFDLNDQNEIDEVVFNLWTDQINLKKQILHNNENIFKYSWDSVALSYLKLFKSL